MGVFFDNAITDGGRQLWAEMQAGGSFVPTKIVVGSGYLPTGKTSRTMTAVAEPVQNISLNKTEKLTGGDYVFGGMFTNRDVTAPFYYRELALYAKVERADGTETAETLYSYGNAGANAELIPAYSTGTAIERQLDIISYIGNDATVMVEIQSGVTVSQQEFNAKVAELAAADETVGKELKNHIGDTDVHITISERNTWNNKVDKVSGKELSTNDYTDTDKEKVDNLPSNTNDALDNKVDKVVGKGLSSNDYTTTEKNKVANLPEDANAELSKKVDKEAGKGLSTEDYTTEEKTKLGSLNAAIIVQSSVSVPTSAWVSDTTYGDYPFRTSIQIDGCTVNHIPEVTFALSDATSGNLAPIAETYDGGVYIYASEQPSEEMTIPTIKLTKVVE